MDAQILVNLEEARACAGLLKAVKKNRKRGESLASMAMVERHQLRGRRQVVPKRLLGGVGGKDSLVTLTQELFSSRMNKSCGKNGGNFEDSAICCVGIDMQLGSRTRWLGGQA